MPSDQLDAIVIGGGLSGLAAADTLKRFGKTFVVLEARERAGGRVYTGSPECGSLDFGAAFVGASQHFVQHYIHRLGVQTFATHLPLDKPWLFQNSRGTVHELPGNEPYTLPGGPGTTLLLGWLDELTLRVAAHLERPSQAPGAAELDEMTAQDLLYKFEREVLGEALSDDGREIFRVSVRSAYSVEPEDLSALFFLYYAACAGSYSALVDVTGGSGAAEATRFSFGASDLVERLRLDVDPEGRRILTNEVVTTIRNDAQGVTVVTERSEYYAKRVIVAMSPTLCRALKYEPELECSPEGALRAGLHSQMRMGHTIKGFVQYSQPFWRVKRSGFALCAGDMEVYPLDWTLDNCADLSARHLVPLRHPFSLMVFMAGRAARMWATKDPAARRQAVIDQLVLLYGPDARALLIEDAEDYVDFDFTSEPFSAGCPTGVMAKGTFIKYERALRQPVGRIHWAGTEAATSWCGYMNGALQSGIRAASEVLTAG